MNRDGDPPTRDELLEALRRNVAEDLNAWLMEQGLRSKAELAEALREIPWTWLVSADALETLRDGGELVVLNLRARDGHIFMTCDFSTEQPAIYFLDPETLVAEKVRQKRRMPVNAAAGRGNTERLNEWAGASTEDRNAKICRESVAMVEADPTLTPKAVARRLAERYGLKFENVYTNILSRSGTITKLKEINDKHHSPT